MDKEFPASFLWGASISSYQCEGGNLRADWFQWEKEKNLTPAGAACNHYRFFDNDFLLARSLHLNALRISLEWSRIEPERGIYDEAVVAHYQKVIDSLLACKLTPFVTLHHFTNPQWFADGQGWLNPANIDHFVAYVKKIVGLLKEKVEFWLIFNEPLVYVYNGFISGLWPPGGRSFSDAAKVLDNMVRAYVMAYDEIKSLYEPGGKEPKVSLTKHMRLFSPRPGALKTLNSLSAFYRSRVFNYQLLDTLRSRGKLDFLGINYYCKEYVSFRGLLGRSCSYSKAQERRNSLGWYVDAGAFYNILMSLKKYKLPVYITENGTTEKQAYLYSDYLRSHLRSLYDAYNKGLDIAGYFWWSLLDNFEWDQGFTPRFGLIEVNYQSFRRSKKQLAHIYADICRKGSKAINDELNGF
jgi:beta-glucosidase